MQILAFLQEVWVGSPWSRHPFVKLEAPPSRDSFLIPAGWEAALPPTDEDYEYILAGVREGFHIVDCLDFKPAEVDNYTSATHPDTRKLVEDQIRNEVTEGRYKIVAEKPIITSALGAVPKPSGGIRLIHDASRPTGSALNDYATADQHLRFQSLADATDLLSPGAYMAKVDLKSAYRSVRVHPSNWPACGIKWIFQGDSTASHMVDTAFPFGSSWTPGIFHRLTQSVRRMMAKRFFQTWWFTWTIS